MVGFCHLPHKPMSHMLFGQSVQVRGAGMRRKDSRWVMCVSCSHYKLIANPSVLSQAYGEYKKMIKAVLWSPECSSTFSLFTEQSVDTSSYTHYVSSFVILLLYQSPCFSISYHWYCIYHLDQLYTDALLVPTGLQRLIATQFCLRFNRLKVQTCSGHTNQFTVKLHRKKQEARENRGSYLGNLHK